MLHLDLRPVGVQFLGDQHRQRGPDALAHFRMRQQHGHAVVGADAQEGVGREAGDCGGGCRLRRARRLAPGMTKPMTRPPPSRALALRNWRRELVVSAFTVDLRCLFLLPSPVLGRRWREASDEGAAESMMIRTSVTSPYPHPNPSPAGEGLKINPCRSPPRDAPPRGCADRCRSGRCCRTGPGRYRYRWVWESSPATPPRT